MYALLRLLITCSYLKPKLDYYVVGANMIEIGGIFELRFKFTLMVRSSLIYLFVYIA